MKDQFNRQIDYLRISVTDRCNLRCRYCMPEEGVGSLSHLDILSFEEILRLARLATGLGVRKIRLTGGEPLVRKGIVSLVRELKALPHSPELVMTTNALLLPAMASELKDAGLSRVNISLDSLREDRFESITRRSGLARVLEGIDAALACGLTPLKINMVPILGVNDDEIVDFARLSLERPLEIRFIEFMPVGSSLGYGAGQRLPAESIQKALEQVGELMPEQRSGPAGPARMYRYPGAPGCVGVIPAVSDHFCGQCNRLRLTADGQLRPCLFSEGEIDVRGPMRQGASDEELEALLLEAVCSKPDRHKIGQKDFEPSRRPMHGIGG